MRHWGTIRCVLIVMTSGTPLNLYTTSGLIACPTCNTLLDPPSSESADSVYLFGESFQCVHCGNACDWWEMVLTAIRENFMGFNAFAAIGAKTTMFMVPAKPGNVVSVDLSKHGVPPDTILLARNLTGCGAIPFETHSNNPDHRARWPTIKFFVAPIEGASHESSAVCVSVTWTPKAHDDVTWENLIVAFEHYAAADYSGMVIPANVAVEAALSRFLFGVLSSIVPETKAKDFLGNAATYSHQLNAVLPLVLLRTGFPCFPDDRRGLLNRLRSLRNQLAHRGQTESPIDQPEAAALLCASLFGFRYIACLEARYRHFSTPEVCTPDHGISR